MDGVGVFGFFVGVFVTFVVGVGVFGFVVGVFVGFFVGVGVVVPPPRIVTLLQLLNELLSTLVPE